MLFTEGINLPPATELQALLDWLTVNNSENPTT
jgi:hypothetical protein